MSFDLMVLIDETDASTQLNWQAKLKDVGIECVFPGDFSVGAQTQGEVLVQCKLNPPLVNESTTFNAYEFYFDPTELNREDMAEMVNSSEDVVLKRKLKLMKSEILFNSSAGRDDHALIVQCYAAATLADASEGVLFDPQEFGAVHGKQVYEVAKHHCNHVIDKNPKTTSSQTKTPLPEADVKVQEPKTNAMSTTLIVLLILLFIAVKNLLTQ